jgi:hypothetical protein
VCYVIIGPILNPADLPGIKRLKDGGMKGLRVLIVMSLFLFTVPTVHALSAVASIKTMLGDVKIQRFQRFIPGRRGLVLNDEDVVMTGQKAKATIIFRDGSEIRLFQNSNFTIEKSEEIQGKGKGFLKRFRLFSNKFKLSTGSFWAKFTKGRQQTRISTPTATCGIKGTVVAFSHRDDKLNVSLSIGEVELENEDEKITLSSGKMIQGITKRGTFKEKVKALPYRLTIIPDSPKIEIPTVGNENQIFFTLQLIDVKTMKNFERSGDVYISMPLDKIVFPERIRLNKRGYSRLAAIVKPFQKADYGLGQVEVLAMIEGQRFMNVGAGQTMLTYDIPKKSPRTIQIDATTGEVK